MKYLLDTNAVIAIMKGHEKFLARLRPHKPADFGMPSVVAYELLYGAFHSQRVEDNLRRVDALRFEVLEFDINDARCAARIRAQLATQGSPIGPYDLLIAGQSQARGLTLITRNLREFQRIPGLEIQDWEA